MDVTTSEEANVKKIVRLSVWFQCCLMLIYISILLFKLPSYQTLAQAFGIFALFVSFLCSRIYIHHGKKAEKLNNFSTKDRNRIKKEYFLYYFLPYPLWLGCVLASNHF